MVGVNYPAMPRGVNVNAIMDATTQGYQGGKDWRDEREYKNEIVPAFSGKLFGAQQAPQTLSSLGATFGGQPQQNTVQRSSLAALDPASARVDQAFAAQGQGRTNLDSNQIAGRFLKTVKDGGVTNPYALAAIASTGAHESGFSPKNAVGTWSDPSQSGQPGTAGGIMSWRGPRLQALQQFAQQNGDDPNAPTPETQGKFLLAEDPSLIQKLQAAQSPQEAQQIMNQAWRFAGYDQQGGEAAARTQSAEAYAPQFGGSGQAPSQQPLEGLAVGQSAQMPQPTQVADASGSFMPQGGGQPQGPASILPPREIMEAMFKNPISRPMAVQLAQAALKLRADQSDPQAQIEYQIAVEKLRQLKDPQSKLINAGGGQIYDPNKQEWISAPAGDDGGNLFDGKSVQAQGLNYLVRTGELTKPQAAQLAAGKTITNPADGSIMFMTPQGLVSQPAGQDGNGSNTITGPKKPSDTEHVTMIYADRMAKSGEIIDALEGAGTSLKDNVASKLPLGNYMISGEYQKFDQAQRDFINAVLRRESGAVISDEEFDNARKQYLPQPGDSPEVLAQKRENRKTATEGMGRAAGPTYSAPGGGAPKGNRTSSGVQWSIEE